MAGALGRCLLRALAAGGRTPVVDQPVISVPDPELVRVRVRKMIICCAPAVHL